MIVFQPDYYDRFQCLAGSCPDSCCQEWAVQVDDQAAARYLSVSGELGDALRQSLKQDEEGYYLQITDRRCPMWQNDGLCRIQSQLGEEGLCNVCREFPRLRHDYGSFVEFGLELSCPEAARLIFEDRSAPTEPVIPPDCEPELALLLESRKEALDLLQTHPLKEALPLLLLYGYRTQNLLDGEDPGPWDSAYELAFAAQAAGPHDWKNLRELYAGLEILTPRWSARLHTQPENSAFPEALAQMVRCCIERYWLQAISDLDLICRVKMILAGTLLVGHLGGDPISTAQLYSKEIDNSIDNLEALLDAAYTHPALTDRHLLGLMQEV